MRFGFTRDDLLTGSSGISDKELSALTTKLIGAGEPSDKIERAIAEQSEKMERYIRRYVLTADHWKELLRKLVLKECYPRVSNVPDKRQSAYDETLRELREIRDGKFPDLPLSDPVPEDISGAGRGRFGSKERLTLR